jgi:hypothetical protein
LQLANYGRSRRISKGHFLRQQDAQLGNEQPSVTDLDANLDADVRNSIEADLCEAPTPGPSIAYRAAVDWRASHSVDSQMNCVAHLHGERSRVWWRIVGSWRKGQRDEAHVTVSTENINGSAINKPARFDCHKRACDARVGQSFVVADGSSD